MFTCPLQISRHVTFCSDFSYSTRSHDVLMPPKRGENVSATSSACAVVRQRRLARGGIGSPLLRTLVVMRQSPGWMPSAMPGPGANNSQAATAGRTTIFMEDYSAHAAPEATCAGVTGLPSVESRNQSGSGKDRPLNGRPRDRRFHP